MMRADVNFARKYNILRVQHVLPLLHILMPRKPPKVLMQGKLSLGRDG